MIAERELTQSGRCAIHPSYRGKRTAFAVIEAVRNTAARFPANNSACAASFPFEGWIKDITISDRRIVSRTDQPTDAGTKFCTGRIAGVHSRADKSHIFNRSTTRHEEEP